MTTPSLTLSPPSTLALWDEPEEWDAFSRLQSGASDVWESHVAIEGMHCATCSITIEEALHRVPGVESAAVSAAHQRARVVWRASQVLPSAWMAAVEAAGYRVLPVADALASEYRRLQTRKALWRWLVAGFCMMQVMMYAYPAYVAQPGDLSVEMERLLRWASWVLSLPVLFFSCGPFFQNALRDIRQRRISMDFPVALGMGITFAVSMAGTFDPQGVFGREVYFDSFTMFVFFLLTGRWLELRLRDRTVGALEVLMRRLPESVERLTQDGVFERVVARRIRVDDTIRIHAGETFLADGVIVQGQTAVDESFLTGESRPLDRAQGDRVMSGSHNITATVQVQVTRIGQQTRFAQILALMDSAATTKPRVAELADRIAKPFLWAVLVAAVAAAAWWWPQDPAHALMVAVAVLVVTCPCALSLATPAAMLAAAGRLARSGVLVRNLQGLEALSTVDTVVFDKTGTLTSDAMSLAQLEHRATVSRAEVLAVAAALAQHSLHPVSRAVVAAAQQEGAESGGWQWSDVSESAGQGMQGILQAAQGKAVHGLLRLGSARFCGIDTPAADGVRVFLADDQGWLATFALQETLRPQVVQMVSGLRAMGCAVHLLSGDSVESSMRVAREAGISHVQGACTPADKLAYLQDLQARGHRVAMVGDGLNDGPVLAAAHVSLAVGTAVPIAQANADLVVVSSQVQRVTEVLVLARKTYRVVRQNLSWSLFYNAACVPLAVVGMLPAWLAGLGMAASSLLVVVNALRLSGSPNSVD